MKQTKAQHIKALRQMTLLHMGKVPLPEIVLEKLNYSNSMVDARKPRTTIPINKIQSVKDHLLEQLLQGKNYATIFSEFEDFDLLGDPDSEFSISFKYITNMLNEINKTLCKLGCYEHREYLILKYEKMGMPKVEIGKIIGMKREAVYIALRKAKKKKLPYKFMV